MSAPRRRTVDLAKVRATVKEFDAEDVQGCLAIFLEASAEMAREIKLTPEVFVHSALEAWAAAHGKVITRFEASEENVAQTDGVEVLVGYGARWGAS